MHRGCSTKQTKVGLSMWQGMNVARLNMSHGDHKSHKAVVDLVREYNRLDRGNVAIMLDTKGPEVRSGDLAEPIDMKTGALPCCRAQQITVHLLISYDLSFRTL